MGEESCSTVAGARHCWREHREFARSFAALEDVYAFVEPLLLAHHVDRAATFAIVVAVEELFTNMVKYNTSGRGPISLELERCTDAVTCRLSDPDSERFDMTRLPEVDTRQSVEQRHPGGLGVHLVRRLVDSIEYDYAGRCSRVSFVRRLAGPERTDHLHQP